MEKFEIYFSEIYGGMVCVEANSLEEAKDKAYDLWASGKAYADGGVQYEFSGFNEA